MVAGTVAGNIGSHYGMSKVDCGARLNEDPSGRAEVRCQTD
jgi:hypothetical protein